MNIYEKLSAIQAELKVPKDQENTFGGYKYRSCEDILEKVKPLCKEHGTVLTLSDTLVEIGGRHYVMATAELVDLDPENGCEIITTTAYAREEETKKGMDGSQITGASSSYARKYALNGLFCIDDVKDSDFTNTGDKPTPRKQWPDSVVEGQLKAEPQKTTGHICIQCGAEVPDNVFDFSMKRYGKCYCYSCQKKYGSK